MSIEYFMDVNAPAQLMTAPAQPAATGVAVCKLKAWKHILALFSTDGRTENASTDPNPTPKV